MKLLFRGALAFLCLSCFVGLVPAQGADSVFIFGEYYVCDQNREDFSDLLTENFFGPILERQIQQGNLVGSGWLGHNAGGEWRRVQYYASRDLNSLLTARDAMIEEFQTKIPSAVREFTDICPDHDDYIWQSVAGSRTGAQMVAERAPAGYSIYFICDVSRQERADEIVKQLDGPILDRLVAEGDLKSWSWYSHVLGGRFRRLMTFDGADHKALLAAVEKYGEQTSKENPELATEFGAICNSHVDYLWDVKSAKP